jgi:hypothetical protein
LPSTSPLQGLTVPLPADAPDGPTQITNLAKALEKKLVLIFTSAAARTSAFTAAAISPSAGMLCWRNDLPGWEFYDGTTWRALASSNGIVAPPVQATTAAAGITGGGGGVEGFDSLITDYTWTSLGTNRRYRVVYSGLQIASGTANTHPVVRIRDGGIASPTLSSTIIVEWAKVVTLAGGTNPEGLATLSWTFVASAGVHKIRPTIVAPAGVGLTPLGTRELYVEDAGSA